MSLIDLAERGVLPDFLIRKGIRRLLRERLNNEQQPDCESELSALNRLRDEFGQGPIAVVPEKANEQHYEVPPEFFQYVLGPRKKYSACHFESGNESLAEAEEAALRISCERAGIEDGMSILELGCGWGSLTLWMAEHFPNSPITAVSNSRSQREAILATAQERGIDRRLTVLTEDINHFRPEANPCWDRVVSIEMFEHMRNHPELLRRISGWLKPDGELWVHIFCHRFLTYPFADQRQSDWMSRYFFSGGIMPADDLLIRCQDDLALQQQWRWNGRHYHLTCERWLENMDRHRQQILDVLRPVYGNDHRIWFQRWRMFFLACSELFRMNDGNEWYVSHYRFANRPATAKPPEAYLLPART